MIRQSYETRSVYEVKQLTDDIDVLMIVHPAGLDDKMLYAIDQFILKGGKAMVFVDPFSEEVTRANQTQRMPPDFGSDFEKLFKAWGIAYDRKKFVGDRQAAQRVAAGEDARGRPIITDYLAWLTFKGEALRRGDPITDELQVINVATAGAIAKADGATIELEPLVATSKDSMLIDVDKVRLEPKPAELMRDFKSDDKSYIIAARMTGVLKTAFPDGPPKDEKAAEKKDETAAPDGEKKEEAKPELPAGHLAQSKGPVNLIVAADVDILADRFWTRIQDFFGQQLEVPIANNADFTLNALDNVAGGTALASLRSRSLTSRPFELVADIQKNAEARFRAKEQQLVQKLEDVEKKLKELQSKQPGQGEGQAQAPTPAQAAAKTILTEQQAKEIDDFRREMVTTRSELREVQRALREDIDKLDARLKVVNIGLMPALVLLVAILLALARRAKARRRHHLPAG
jgi:ABC-type uncharacterized transport system involved in gliding motility auxiliary subunit